MCSLFHAFMFAQLWTIYCEQAAAAPTGQNQNQNEFSSGAILTGLEFWSRVTPSILQLMAHNKVVRPCSLKRICLTIVLEVKLVLCIVAFDKHVFVKLYEFMLQVGLFCMFLTSFEAES